MANLKISQLTDGTPIQATDQFPINRAGANFRVQNVAPLDSPVFTTQITLPAALVTNNTNRVTLSPASGTTVDLTAGTNKTLAIQAAGGNSQVLLDTGGNISVQSDNTNVNSIVTIQGGTTGGVQFACPITFGTNLAGNSFAAVNLGVPFIVASSSLTVQAAAQSAVTIYNVPGGQGGLYRLNYRASVTRAATTSSTLGGANGFQIIYTDLNDSVVKTSNPTTPVVSSVNATGTTISGTVLGNAKAATAINFSFGYTSSGATTMQYDLDVYVEYLG